MAKASHPLRSKAFRILHEQGWLGTEIAAAFGLSSMTVSNWRRSEGLEARRHHNRIDDRKAFQMYEEGKNDHEIARFFGVDPSSVCVWRRKKGLSANVEQKTISPPDRRRAKKMLREGATRRQVAEAIGCSENSVGSIRAEMPKDGLRKTGISNRIIRGQVLADPSILPRIRRAVGKNPDHISEDAICDLYTDVLDGRVSADLIEKMAPRYRNRAYEMCGSAYGSISLDVENENGMRLVDLIPDPTFQDY